MSLLSVLSIHFSSLKKGTIQVHDFFIIYILFKALFAYNKDKRECKNKKIII